MRRPTLASRMKDIGLALTMASMGAAAVRAAAAFEKMNEAMRKVQAVSAYHREIRLCGLESRMYVRAAMDPAYATPDGLDTLIRKILKEPDVRAGEWVLPADRPRLAAAAMRGWAEHRAVAESPEVLAWHRHLSDQNVFVGRDAEGHVTMTVTPA